MRDLLVVAGASDAPSVSPMFDLLFLLLGVFGGGMSSVSSSL